MRLADILFLLFRFLLPPALIATTYLYLYAAFQGCAFPEARKAEAACLVPGSQRPAVAAEQAPFRLLALGDPQLEGDTSLPDRHAPTFPSLQILGLQVWQKDIIGFAQTLFPALGDALQKDLPKVLQGYRKKVDLWGNDLYLAHIYRTVHWWTQPTHVVVLGDLLGSQWIGDDEFRRRGQRFWRRVFAGAEKVPESVMDVSGHAEFIGQDLSWNKRLIAVAGNHDIGYAGDIDDSRIGRFESAYGRVNWDITFKLLGDASGNTLRRKDIWKTSLAPGEISDPSIHLVILNTMNLDEPAWKPHLREQTLEFLETALAGPTDTNSATILLTHVPLHKEAGVCKDGPFFSHFPLDNGGGIKEQNHISQEMSAHVLELLTGPNNHHQAVILTGHDHEGCDTYHYLTEQYHEETGDEANFESDIELGWAAEPSAQSGDLYRNESISGVREVTVRSMMGEFSGYAGLFSAWWDTEAGKWQFEFDTCVMGVQHIWWAVHVLDLIVIGLLVGTVVLEVIGMFDVVGESAEKEKKA